jgi:hypothetical protein
MKSRLASLAGVGSRQPWWLEFQTSVVARGWISLEFTLRSRRRRRLEGLNPPYEAHSLLRTGVTPSGMHPPSPFGLRRDEALLCGGPGTRDAPRGWASLFPALPAEKRNASSRVPRDRWLAGLAGGRSLTPPACCACGVQAMGCSSPMVPGLLPDLARVVTAFIRACGLAARIIQAPGLSHARSHRPRAVEQVRGCPPCRDDGRHYPAG